VRDVSTEPARRRRLALRPPILVASVVAGLLLALVIDIARAGGVETWAARHGIAPPYDARGRIVEVEGRDVYLDCRGTGSPTVILEAGFGSGPETWGYVLDGVAGFTRACAWDRPGIGRSAGRGTHSAGAAEADLHEALRIAGERPPYVLVPHSLGGVYSRIFAGLYRDEVVAILAIDTYDPDLGLEDDPTLPADYRAARRAALVSTAATIEAGEDLDWTATLAELAAASPFTGPAVVLSTDPRLRLGGMSADEQAAAIAAGDAAVRRRYPNVRIEIVPNTGHLIQLERPSLVIERIRELVLSLR
jgi:pimeloyl-ACP methyl ester carboxylesterase